MKRVEWMDGLRGLAAMQVLLLHYVSAFLPAIGLMQPELAHYGWERYFIQTPLFMPLDGYSAVYLFFVLSGVALTYSFNSRPLALTAGVVRRAVRLGVPMAVALVLAGVLLALFPEARGTVAKMTGSEGWLGALAPLPVNVGGIAHQIAFEGMLTGYSDTSFWPSWVVRFIDLVPFKDTYLGPVWTLHVEFVGSILILILVSLRSLAGPKIHCIVCIVFLVFFTASALVLFVVGHLAAAWLPRLPTSRLMTATGISLLLGGIILCTSGQSDLGMALLKFLPPAPIGVTVSSITIVRMLGSILVFSGIAITPPLQRGLKQPAIKWLGKISFGLYLTHFALLITAVSCLFTVISPLLPYGIAVATTTIVGISTSCWIAGVFEKWVDRPAIELSRRLSRLSARALSS